jgi:hypothetical protein
VVAIFSARETFAEVAMFLGGRYPASCEAVSTVRILKIDAANLRRAVLAEPQLAFDTLAAASVRLRQLVDEIEQLKARSVPQRIADFFVKQAGSASGAARIELPYEKALIAGRLGMKPESFSRALGRLTPLGVTVERECVTIDDVAKLRRFRRGRGITDRQPRPQSQEALTDVKDTRSAGMRCQRMICSTVSASFLRA